MGKPKKNKAANGVAANNSRGLCKKAKEWIENTLFPPSFVCIDCGKELGDMQRTFSLCDDCIRRLPYVTGNRCRYCAEVIEHSGNVCKRCQTALPYYDKVYAPFAYDGLAKKMILSYKDGEANYLYKHIARFMSDYYNAMGVRCDVICYVPSGKKKVLRRGFQHNKKVAETISVDTQTPLTELLRIVRPIKDQTKKRRAERLDTIKGVFAPIEGTDKTLTDGKAVLLIDDVVTTGATAGECARVLKTELGAKAVFVLALARA